MVETLIIAEKKVLKNRHNCQLLESHQETETQTLRGSVERAMNNYFSHLDGQDATNVYEMVLSEVEAPLFKAVMSYVQGNQSKAATLLGLNRGTLRKKLKQYYLM